MSQRVAGQILEIFRATEAENITPKVRQKFDLLTVCDGDMDSVNNGVLEYKTRVSNVKLEEHKYLYTLYFDTHFDITVDINDL